MSRKSVLIFRLEQIENIRTGTICSHFRFPPQAPAKADAYFLS